MSVEHTMTLRSAGRLYRLSGFQSLDHRARLVRSVRQALRAGATISDVATAALLSPSTIRKYSA